VNGFLFERCGFYKRSTAAISNFYADHANIEGAVNNGAVVMRFHPGADRHLLGIGTAIAVFLVLSLVKLGAFLVVHADMMPRQTAPDHAAVRTASSAMRVR
jgi:hypothetical protein